MKEFRAWTGSTIVNDIAVKNGVCYTFEEDYIATGEEYEEQRVDIIVKHPDWVPLQYTGLLDKNKKKIFEGDYMKMKDGRIYSVVFKRGKFFPSEVTSKEKEGGYLPSNWFYDYDVIIGNIYQNKDLIN